MKLEAGVRIELTIGVLQIQRDNGISVFSHPYNRGKGAALRTALEHATGEIILIQDAGLAALWFIFRYRFFD
jgi:glycosyltransferase involved in cell wall biosynthesis